MVQSCAAESETTLDNPAWWALTGVDRHLSERKGKARRYKPAVSPLAAVSDEHDPQAWADMAEPLDRYTAGSAGPREADRLMERDGRRWRRLAPPPRPGH